MMLWGLIYPVLQLVTLLSAVLLALLTVFHAALLALSIIACAWVWWWLFGRVLGPPRRVP